MSIASRAKSLIKIGLEARNSDKPAIINRLSSLEGLPHKFAQILELKGDTGSGQDETKIAQRLDLEQVKQILSAHLGEKALSSLHKISPDGICASIAQVHKAELKGGEQIALKIKYPGVERSIEEDLKLLGWLSLPLSAQAGSFALNSYKSVLRDQLRMELSFSDEAEALKRFQMRLLDVPNLSCPSLKEDFCSDQTLGMSWEGGQGLWKYLSVAKTPQRLITSRALASFFLRSLFEWKELHADPNAGNYLFDERTGGVTVLDFGSTLVFSPEQSFELYSFLEACAHGEGSDILKAYELIGFDMSSLETFSEKAVAFGRMLSEPFWRFDEFDASRWRIQERSRELLGEHRVAFRVAGPANQIFLIRAYSGLIQILAKLGCGVGLKALFESLKVDRSASQERAKPSTVIIEDQSLELDNFKLCIQVKEGAREKVRLQFKGSVLPRIEDLLDPDLKQRLEDGGREVSSIASQFLKEGVQAGEIFCEQVRGKEVKVWLEPKR